MYLLGYDIGSSSIKAALVNATNLKTIATIHYPDREMDIIARQSGWAEQQPEVWWDNLINATHRLFEKTGIKRSDVKAIGISYQMHGLVLIDRDHHVLRPSIIWCDSRAVGIGEQALDQLGDGYCFGSLLNSPANFTASKLKWVKDNEPEVFERIYKVLLPGDYINLKLTGEINTTVPGLSEGVFWNFDQEKISEKLLDYFGYDQQVLPEIVETFGVQGQLCEQASDQLGLPKGLPVAYRAGDQPNNAMALNVLKAGEVAATGGTSGVVFGVTNELVSDPLSRVNSFAHVNHSKIKSSIGMLLCINGAGIQYSWMKHMLATEKTSYADLERIISSVPVNSDGLMMMPFGNGAERMLQNQDIGGRLINLNLNRHAKGHLYRAALEGIAYAFVYGMEILMQNGLEITTIKVGNDNLFQSSVFSTTIASVLGVEIEVIETTGAIGAAKAAGVGLGLLGSLEEVMSRLEVVSRIHAADQSSPYFSGFSLWKAELLKLLNWSNKDINRSHEHNYRSEGVF